MAALTDQSVHVRAPEHTNPVDAAEDCDLLILTADPILRIYPIPCGSEPARDDGVSDNIIVDWKAAIASRLAPTGECVLIRGLCLIVFSVTS